MVNMQQFNVTGMSCAACSARVEKAVRAVKGVSDCSVNLLTGSMSVEGNVESGVVIDAVVKPVTVRRSRENRKKKTMKVIRAKLKQRLLKTGLYGRSAFCLC